MIEVYLLTVVQIGAIYGFVALAVCIAFRFLSFPDLSPDGTFVVGAVATAQLIALGFGWSVAMALAFVCGAMFGMATAALNRLLGINKFFAGILVAMALYSINLRMLGGANLSIFGQPTAFPSGGRDVQAAWTSALALATAVLIVFSLFHTHYGLRLRGLGSNVLALRTTNLGAFVLTAAGLALANGIAALGGSLLCQLQSFADVNMGIGVSVVGFASLFLGEATLIMLTLLGGHKGIEDQKSQHSTRPVHGELVAVVIGAVILTAISSATLYFSLPPSDLKLVSAVILVGALILRRGRISTWLMPGSKFEQ